MCRAGKQAPPAHWPSSACKASSLAPQPSSATRARSFETTSIGAWIRSLSTCQRIAGSESSSHSSVVMPPSVSGGSGPPERTAMRFTWAQYVVRRYIGPTVLLPDPELAFLPTIGTYEQKPENLIDLC